MNYFVFDWASIGSEIIGHALDEKFKYVKLLVKGYKPFCYYEGESMPSDCDVLREYYMKKCTSNDVATSISFYEVYFDNKQKMDMFVKKYKRCHMHDIPQTTMFLASKNLETVGWVKVDEGEKYERPYERVVHMNNISVAIDINTVPVPKILVFDIEVRSSDLSMPKAYRYDDSVQMISVIVRAKDEEIQKWIMHTYNSFCIDKSAMLQEESNEFCKYLYYKDECKLILAFFELIKMTDPDIITGYNIYGFDFDYLLSRLNLRLIKMPNVSRYGNTEIIKVDWESSAYGPNKYKRLVLDGRLILDMFLYFKRLKFEKYSLDYISQKLLNSGKLAMPFKKMNEILWSEEPAGLREVAAYCMRDSELVLKLFDKVDMWIDVCEVAKIMQCRIEDIYTRGEQMKVVAQCVRECMRRNMVLVPSLQNKQWYEYKGAYVMEPVKGIYKQCVLLDFQSLYPSIIIAYNICVSTYIPSEEYSRVRCPFNKIENHVFRTDVIGLFPYMVSHLLSERKAVKQMMKNTLKTTAAYTVLNRRQNALKLCANSVYGIMGSKNSKYFGHVACAESVTAMGRYWLLNTANTIKKLYPKLSVIYGDTDSCMIHGGQSREQSIDLGKEICNRINETLKEPMSLTFEAYYECVILLNKKKYIMLDGDDNITYKGVMSARRDYCVFAKKAYIDTLKYILHGGDVIDMIQHVTEHIDRIILSLKSGDYEISDLVITKSVRALDSYKVEQPHVKFAKRLEKAGHCIIPGMRIEYVFVQTLHDKTIVGKRCTTQADKMRTPEEVKAENLKIDAEYYIIKQLLTQLNDVLELLGINGYVENRYLSGM